MTTKTFIVAPYDGKYSSSYLIAIALFSPSLTVYEILSNQEQCQNFDLANEDQGQGVENGTCAIRHSNV